MGKPKLTIAELAALVGVTPRTIRHYMAEGVLPLPSGSGKQQFYDHRHVVRLRLAKLLRDEGLPVSKVRHQLSRWAPKQMEEALALADRMRKHPVPPHELLKLWDPGRLAPVLPRTLLRQGGMIREAPTFLVSSTDADAVHRVAQSAQVYSPQEEPWLRVRVAPQVEIQYHAAENDPIKDAVRDIIDFARQRLATVLDDQQPAST
jgi:DNA-binding transcriptional MerR regulator